MGFAYSASVGQFDWLALTIGHLSANKYWGETTRRRSPLCTSTLIATPSGLVLVDPPVQPPEMAGLLMNQAGVDLAEIARVFLTHFHGDHRFGLEALPDAIWLMAAPEIEHSLASATDVERSLLARIQPAGAEIVPGLRCIHTPGHTPGLSSVLFPWRGRQVAVCGDAVMTEDHFRACEGHHNSTDFAQAAATIEWLASEVDVVVPGHGLPFDVDWTKTPVD